MLKKIFSVILLALASLNSWFAAVTVAAPVQVLVEAESFESHGGWSLDTQFIRQMGSPYLLAHGLGQPVADAVTMVKFTEPGVYHVFVRTKDWVARWKAEGQPGKFELLIDNVPIQTTFGTTGAQWNWQAGGTIEIKKSAVELRLRDSTGFDGRCDAICFTKSDEPPPNESEILPQWRRAALELDEQPTLHSDYDLVVVGGGYSGMGAAISAARMGCKVALIQDRPVLGGNGSSEVRVWAMGNIRRGKYPRIGEIVDEFSDRATKSPGTFEEFGDARKEAIVRAEPNIDLFLNHHAFAVDMADEKIVAVHAFDTQSSEQSVFSGRLFCDATGHGTLGELAGAQFTIEAKGRMGMSNMWAWDEATDGDATERAFPETPWALDLNMADFPYPVDHHGQWFWESGFDKDPLGDAEGIRDWNLRAVFGAFNAMKNRDGAEQHKSAYLTWVAFVGGPRESRQLLGDVVLTQDDIVTKRDFTDGCVPSTWSIDLHYPKKQYAEKFPDNPFISIAEHDQRIDRDYGYPVPYRCFYSKNIENMFMAGRCISVTHEALGTVRVMKTCGMMGEVVGKAASICVARDCLPYAVYERYWPEMDSLLQLPGKAHRPNVEAEFTIPADALPLAPSTGPPKGLDPSTLPGIVIDDSAAITTGKWESGGGLKGFVGNSYRYAPASAKATIEFSHLIEKSGAYEIRLATQPADNRATNAAINIVQGDLHQSVRVDMRQPPNQPYGFVSLGTFALQAGQMLKVTLDSESANGFVHADAIQILPAP